MTTMQSLPLPNQHVQEACEKRQLILTKPFGSLGRLEALAIQMAAFQNREAPQAGPCACLIFAADHEVTRHGISAFPSAVTAAMLHNFAQGGAAAAVLAREEHIALHVFDVGVLESNEGSPSPPEEHCCAQMHRLTPQPKAGDIRAEDALTPEAFEVCAALGKYAVRRHARIDPVVIFGEMGIGNTTPAAAISAYLLKHEQPHTLVGRGTGVSDEMLGKKRAVVMDVLRRLPENLSGAELIQRAGGRELAAIYGAMRCALLKRKIVLVDGFIVTSVAAALMHDHPEARAGLVFAHCSEEQGHRAVLRHLDVEPLLDLGLRLGEGSGALCAYALLRSACALHNQMATFASANVPGAGP